MGTGIRIALVAVGALALAVAGWQLDVTGAGSRQSEPVAVPPPIAKGASTPGQVAIPEGFLSVEEVAKKPLEQPEIRWVRKARAMAAELAAAPWAQ